jgi:adenosylcobinamide-phosphate synthase
VGLIVGRDTAQLEEAEVVRATIETVAENLVDGVIAPLFYAFLGGAPLALAYRAINTMDSMLGYKNSRYLYFGRFAARLDDVANFLPARLTGFFICLVALISPQLQAKGAWQAWREDAKKHPSPNSGIPEASVAGALGIRLGGVNYYQGIAQERAAMGPGRVPLAITHIKDTINIMYQAAILGAFLMIILYFNLLNKLGGGL